MPTGLDNTFYPLVGQVLARVGVAATLEAAASGANFNPGLGRYEKPDNVASSAVTSSPPAPITERYATEAVRREASAMVVLSGKELAELSTPIEPKAGGFLTIAGTRFAIVNAEAIWSGEQVAAWVVYLKL